MDTTKHTRRAALGIVAASPFALIPALSKGDAAGSGAVAKAIDQYQTAAAACTKFEKDVHAPALARWKADLVKLPVKQTTRCLHFDDGLKPMRADDEHLVGMARRFVVRPGQTPELDPEYWDAMCELVVLADERDNDLATLRTRHRIDENLSASEALGDKAYDAEQAVIDAQCASLDELSLKLDFIADRGGWDDSSTATTIAADLRRLVGRA